MTLADFIEASPNLQSVYLRGVSLDELAIVGITELYDETLALFRAVFGIELDRTLPHRNVNPAHQGAYEITPELRGLFDKYLEEDIALYREAKERFATLLRRYDI